MRRQAEAGRWGVVGRGGGWRGLAAPRPKARGAGRCLCAPHGAPHGSPHGAPYDAPHGALQGGAHA
jgi:hypothetical protein